MRPVYYVTQINQSTAANFSLIRGKEAEQDAENVVAHDVDA